MSDRLKRLREQRGAIVTEMQGITDLVENEKRDLNAEELTKHTELFDKTENLRQQILAQERSEAASRENASGAAEEERARREKEGGGDGTPAADTEKRQLAAFDKFLRHGRNALTDAETRDLEAGRPTDGGFISTPQQFVTKLIKNLDNEVFIRSRATKFQVPMAESLGAPSLDSDPDDFEWTAELATGSNDTGMKFGKRELIPNPLAKRIKLSKKLLRVAALPVTDIVNQRMGYKLGVTQEKGYLIGDGNKKPLGVFTPSNDGIPTSRDVSTGNTATSMTFDGLISAKMSLKAQYWNRADWMFHRDAVAQLMKLKDGDGNYMWRMSVRDGEPDSLYGRPLMISEYAPNTFTTGLYAGIFGDFSNYWIVDSLDFQIQRLVELYAETNQDGFIARYEGDGMPVLAEAFARVKLA